MVKTEPKTPKLLRETSPKGSPVLERAQRSADRTNAKRIDKFAGTLFADDADLIGPLRTAEEVIDLVEDKFAHMAAVDRRQFVAGTYYRHLYRQKEGNEATAWMQARFLRVLPHAPAYWADFWWQRLKGVDAAVLPTIDRQRIPILPESEVVFV